MLRIAARMLLAVFATIPTYFLAAFLGAFIPGASAHIDGESSTRLGLVSGDIHYDFLIPLTPEVRNRFGFAAADGVPLDHPGAEWLIVGWGAAEFYTTVGGYGDIGAKAIWRGATGDSAVLRLDAIGALYSEEGVAFVSLSDAQFEALLTAIEGSFIQTGTRAPTPLAIPGFTETDSFYPAKGRFNLTRTCNIWVGEMLRAAGLRFGAWTPTPYSVRLSLWWFETAKN